MKLLLLVKKSLLIPIILMKFTH